MCNNANIPTPPTPRPRKNQRPLSTYLADVVHEDRPALSRLMIRKIAHRSQENPIPVATIAVPFRPVSKEYSPVYRLHQMTSIQEESETMSLSSSRNYTCSMPLFNISHSIRDMTFDELCSDPSVLINPRKLGFIPLSGWQNDTLSFGLLVATFFRKRNSSHCKFPYKLYNVLKLTSQCPEFIPHVGIQWVTDEVILVHREAFARLLGVKTVEGGLFHQQGNFPSHNFVELTFEESVELSEYLGIERVDLSVVRFVRHSQGEFLRSSTEADIEKCKWKGNS